MLGSQKYTIVLDTRFGFKTPLSTTKGKIGILARPLLGGMNSLVHNDNKVLAQGSPGTGLEACCMVTVVVRALLVVLSAAQQKCLRKPGKWIWAFWKNCLWFFYCFYRRISQAWWQSLLF